MTVDEIIQKVRDVVGDPEEVANTFAEPQVLRAINEACAQFARLTGSTFAREAFEVTNLSGIATLHGRVMDIRRVHFIEGGFPLGGPDAEVPTEMNPTLLSRSTAWLEGILHPQWMWLRCANVNNYRDWPKRWILFGNNAIRVVPKPQSGADSEILVEYIERPNTVSRDTGGEIDSRIDEDRHEVLAYLAGSVLLQLDSDRQDAARSKELWDLFHAQVGISGVDAQT